MTMITSRANTDYRIVVDIKAPPGRVFAVLRAVETLARVDVNHDQRPAHGQSAVRGGKQGACSAAEAIAGDLASHRTRRAEKIYLGYAQSRRSGHGRTFGGG